MESEIIATIVSLAGTLIGSFTGIMVANKLVNYRLEKLENKVEMHNGLIERVALVERDEKVIFERLAELQRKFGA